jgi:site-specific DNA recombinase
MPSKNSGKPLRAVGYVRVSTRRQAQHQISLAEQEKRIRAYCDEQGIDLADIYVEPGATARNDRRRVFQHMIEDAAEQPRPFELVLILNFSRFFRDDFSFEEYRRKLEMHGVELRSISQQLPEGLAGTLARKVTTLVDGYQSEVNAEQTRMAMEGNAAAGYWNGSIPPFGYRTYAAERLAKKDKKKLEIDPMEAPVVRLIFDLYSGIAEEGGPMGVIKITQLLNARGYMLRGKPFRTATVHAILHRDTYAGTHYYNRTDSRTRQARPREDWITVSVPPIVPVEQFERVRATLAAHDPRVIAPRTVNSPTLLAGVGRCKCGAGLLLRTGKGGRYRYLVCERRRSISKDACDAPAAPMAIVDDIVLSVLEERILQSDRLEELLSAVLDRSEQAENHRRADLKVLRAEKTRIEGQKMNLLELVEAGHLNARDPQLAEKLKAHGARLASLDVETRTLERQLAKPGRVPTPELLQRFAALIREKLRDDNPTLRRAYLRMLVSEVVVADDTVTIRGSKKALTHAIFAREEERTGVLTFIQDWRTRQDSNLWPLPSEGSALSS